MPKAKVSTTAGEYIVNGVALVPATPAAGEPVKVIYDGLLAKSGADSVFAHIGYGSNWDNSRDYQMSKSGIGFEATVPVQSSSTLNLCFKDNAGNWDNNSGKNYTFDIT